MTHSSSEMSVPPADASDPARLSAHLPQWSQCLERSGRATRQVSHIPILKRGDFAAATSGSVGAVT